MRKLLVSMFLSIILVVTLVACSGGSKSITIGAQTYTETKILAYMYKELIENETDIKVDVKPDLATSPIVLEGMQNGDLDMSTQFTGTAISSFTDIENPKDAEATIQQAKDFFSGEDFNFEFFDALGYANTYAFAVRKDVADEYNLTKVSDVATVAGEFSAGFDTAWMERENDGYPAFKETYGFEFGETNPMEIGLVYDAVKNEDVDIVLAYSTDPRIVAFDLVILEDDENFFPPYDAAPVIRQETLDEYPEIADIIAPLIDRFDEETIGNLNGKVDLDEEEIEDVAHEYLENENLLK